MSGHSKFANIRAKKEKNDAAKGKAYTVIGREIAIAVKEGGPDPNNNFKLKFIIQKAKAANMPNDTIKRSIAKAAGELGDKDYKELTYEGYGVGGAAVIITTLTDNVNRTAGDVRSTMSKCGGQMGNTGCVSYMFDKKGYFAIERTPELDEDKMMEYCLEDLKEKAETLPRKANEDAGLMARGILVNLGVLDIDLLHGEEAYMQGLKLNHGRRSMTPEP